MSKNHTNEAVKHSKAVYEDRYKPRNALAAAKLRAHRGEHRTSVTFDGQVRNQAFTILNDGSKIDRRPLYEVHSNGYMIEITDSFRAAQEAFNMAGLPRTIVEVGEGNVKCNIRSTSFFGRNGGV